MSMGKWARAPWWALCVAAVALSGCGNRHADLLVVASADCQGYLDPCG